MSYAPILYFMVGGMVGAMPKIAKELSEVSIRRLKHTHNSSGEPYKAVHPVGGVSGLYLQCFPPVASKKVGAKTWLFRAVIGNKRRWIGLGNYPNTPTKKAREAARALKEDIKNGIDPVQAKASALAELKALQAKHITFERFARETFIPKEGKNYKGTDQVRRMNQLLRDYVFPKIGHLVIEDITKDHVEDVIKPLWETKNETARRTLNYVHKIFAEAIDKDLREKGNPAIWKDALELRFAKKEVVHKVKSHRAIDWELLPKFVKAVQALDKPKGSRPEVDAMLLMILTVGRPQEVRFGDWEEIDLKNKIWHQPKGKYKSAKLDWDIPLCTNAIKILKRQPSYAKQKGRIFSTLNGVALHDRYLSTLPDALGFDGVAHGFRATFRTWAQKHQKQYKFVEEELELCMKHCDTVSTRAAYARDQLFKERVKVIRHYERWAMTGKKK